MGFGEASDVSACYYAGANDKYTGMNQNRMAYFHCGDAKFIMLTTELLKNTGNRNLRLGLNQWYYLFTGLIPHASTSKLGISQIVVTHIECIIRQSDY